jgi:thioesterase domain-containing protein
MQPQGDRTPFFCVHQLNGSILSFFDLAERLAPDQPFYAIQPRGWNGETPLDRVEDLAAYYLDEIRRVQPGGPYHLGGRCSIGGMIAYEMAQQLLAQGERVEVLVLFDTINPLALKPPRAKSTLRRLHGKLKARIKLFRRSIPGIFDKQARRLIRMREANATAVKTYVPKPYPGWIILFQSEERRQKAKRNPWTPIGWGGLALGGMKVHLVNSDHVHILKLPYVLDVVKTLREYLIAGSAAVVAGAVESDSPTSERDNYA